MGLGSANASPVPGDARRFAAFISYSHADADAAAKLQRRLERYRLPKRIAETRASDATALGAIFRDREDLAAAASLSAAIRDAIGRAEALIVMCSPEGASSPWVAAEIELFRGLHPEKTDIGGVTFRRACNLFPRCADSWRQRTPRRRPAPERRRRTTRLFENRRRHRRSSARHPHPARRPTPPAPRDRHHGRGAGSNANHGHHDRPMPSKPETRPPRQRAAAEELVEYMLTDLREKLKGVGRLDVMEGVNHRAMQHYRKQGSLSTLPTGSLERRARILHAMGEDDGREGNLATAEQKFLEADRTTKALLSKDPTNPDRIFANAQSEYWLGFTAWQQRDRKKAARHWERYLDAATDLNRKERGSMRAYLEISYAHVNICGLNFRDRFNLPNARENCEAAIRHAKLALGKSSGNEDALNALANAFGWLADVWMALGEPASASDMRDAEAAVLTRLLADDPKNVAVKYRLSVSHMGKGKAVYEGGDQATAARLLKGAVTDMQEIWKSDEADQSVELQLLRARVLLWEAERDAGLSQASLTRWTGPRSCEKPAPTKCSFIGGEGSN